MFFLVPIFSRPKCVMPSVPQVVDDNTYFEIMPEWAKNITIGFARMEGHPVGVIANNPLYLAGCLDIDTSTKASLLFFFFGDYACCETLLSANLYHKPETSFERTAFLAGTTHVDRLKLSRKKTTSTVY